uniref:Macaca fascicularis brain cDNA clone: QflA-17617, similar to human acyl-CoA synthetase long-chain family member 3 (ACSL3),transcript variant 2, mRNA, RefSeq: NM_203372.1 n=1 Tax=Macaca fascicularis TaxID=9541 RepID=I7G5G1_MACFA|nr:unnamed protein product [Macaca fascicularis]
MTHIRNTGLTRRYLGRKTLRNFKLLNLIQIFDNRI